MKLHDKHHTCSLRVPDSQVIYFANTLALTPLSLADWFNLWFGPILVQRR